ncbi:N-acetylmannosamine-6-phosphate 2-epimerase [Georgenia faecalis]|uniref:Putative N-acetylmannosamine-6-phosphate 2-epimerase n=1 Tax=Georgenia faecalis TaxID=2483799 RepID=A0ABV9D9A5_9MICO|nr:N-acetylmannosamine-6-phosphate 2-epimerase [Georgenia faecalis]
MPHHPLVDALRGGLVVSCQALPGEPLYVPAGGVMPLLAKAAELAGAVGIRANSARDVREIKAAVDLPVIGLVKKDYPPGEAYITVTMAEIDDLVAAGADVIAMDATLRPRFDGVSVADFVAGVRRAYPDQLLMADIATLEEGVHAAEIGFDLVGTTLSGYTPQSTDAPAPNVELVRELAARIDVPVVAEGRIRTPEQARTMLDAGAYCVVVGGAITRPLEIATGFVEAMRP